MTDITIPAELLVLANTLAFSAGFFLRDWLANWGARTDRSLIAAQKSYIIVLEGLLRAVTNICSKP